MPDFLFSLSLSSLSSIANAIFTGGEHEDKFQGVERFIKRKTDGVRRKKKSISLDRIHVLIRAVKDVWEVAI